MKTYRNLYLAICSWENLYHAARKAMKRKRYKRYVERFWLNLEPEITAIRRQLIDDSYCPGHYRRCPGTEPK